MKLQTIHEARYAGDRKVTNWLSAAIDGEVDHASWPDSINDEEDFKGIVQMIKNEVGDDFNYDAEADYEAYTWDVYRDDHYVITAGRGDEPHTEYYVNVEKNPYE